MRALDLALKDLTELVRDWKSALFLVALPIVFTLMFGFAFGGFGGAQQDPRLPVGYLDLDEGGPFGASLLGLLNASEAIRPVVQKDTEVERLDTRVRNSELAAAVVVPAGYSQALLAGTSMRVIAVADQGTAGQTAQSEIRTAVIRLAGSVEAAELSAQAYEDQALLFPGTIPQFADEAARREFVLEAAGRALTAWQQPPLTIDVQQSGARLQKPSTMQTGFSHTSPSMMVQFAIAGLIGAASVLVHERKTRSLRRLLTTAISRTEIILGHYLAMFLLILLQFVILVAFGQLALQVPYMRQPVATLLVMVSTALWTAGLGLLIGTLAKTDDQVILFSLLPMFVLAGMGGAWIPLEYTGKTFAAIGHVLPTAWSMDGFENIVIRGLGLESVLLPCGILLAYAVGLVALAAWRFRYE